MIPAISNNLNKDFVIKKQPSKTYHLNFEKNMIMGTIDEREAIKQAIYLILNTERYDNLIYSWRYGIELNGLYGQSVPYVFLELKRRITEALMQDDRIMNVDDFNYEVMKRQVHVAFTVHTIYGDVDAQKVVKI